MTKYHLSNGVLQTLVASFVYDAGTRAIAHQAVEIFAEMWPPVDDEALDPLQKLKASRADTLVEVDLVAEAQAKTAQALGR